MTHANLSVLQAKARSRLYLRRRQSGFSLLFALIALIILLVAAVSVMQSSGSSPI